MLLDFSVDWRWVIGGTDVSPFVETWELAREQPDMGTPAWWRGKLVLRPVVGRDLNLDPLTNSLWRQGTSCSLTVAGSLVFTGSILLAYYDDWSTAPRLELEVGDVLAAKNHRQVIPFGEYDAQSLLAVLGIPGVAPAGDAVEISTDLTSPVKVAQELTWVARLKSGLPATLFTRPDGQVDYVSPQAEISLTRTLEQVADFTRQRPALEIPGSVVASASLTYRVQPPAPRPDGKEEVFISQEEDLTKITYTDSLGRLIREEIYRGRILEARSHCRYEVYNWRRYEFTKNVWVRDSRGELYRFESISEMGSIERFGTSLIKQGVVVATKKIVVFWPRSRLFPVNEHIPALAYLVEEYQVVPTLGIGSDYRLIYDDTYLLRLTTRAKGTTQDADTLSDALALYPTVNETFPRQEIQFPDWARLPQPENITDALSEEVAVVGFTGPPVHLSVPWPGLIVSSLFVPWFHQIFGTPLGLVVPQEKLENLRSRLRSALRAAAQWMAIEIGGRAFARRIKMPVPPEWLGDPRPWTLARIGNEVFWLVGETLRGSGQGVEFEATGILAGRPNTIPPGEFPPGMIPSFIPLITVAPTRFPQIGIGCEMSAGEMVAISGDPWLGMAVEIEYATSDPAASVIIGIGVDEVDGSRPGVGAGWLGIPEVWLGFAADATYEITGDDEEEDDGDDGEAEGLTLEAENGVIEGGIIVYDADASSCYAVTTEYIYYSVYFSIDSTSLDWERPLRLRIIYKSAGDGAIDVFVGKERSYFHVDFFEVSETFGYVAEELVIPTSLEPFDEILVDIEKRSDEFLLDAIQLAPADGDWPPLNPCSD